MQRFRRFARDNGLSIAFMSLFVIFLFGQSAAGYFLFNQHRREHGLEQIGYAHFLGSGTFLEAVSSNWQAAILQLLALIVLGIVLRQKGAPHSRKPGAERRSGASASETGRPPSPVGPSGDGRQTPRVRASWLYRNSLGLAFAALFVCTFALHVASGAADYNEQQRLMRQPPVSIGTFLISAQFWFTTLAVWQAESFAMGVFVILSIYLRQEGSPESKPVSSPDDATGEHNE